MPFSQPNKLTNYPPGNSIILYGDSITDQNISGSNPLIKDAWGAFIWANIMLNQRFNILDIHGMVGATTAVMLANFSQYVLNNPNGKPDWVCIDSCGVNDAYNYGSVNTIANLTAMFNMCANAGIGVMASTITSGSWSYAITINRYSNAANAQQALNNRQDVNQWLRDYSLSNPNIILFDYTATLLTDVSTVQKAARNDANLTYFRDPATFGIHPDILGSKVKAQIIYNTINALIPQIPLTFAGQQDGTNGNLDTPIKNGLFVGTGGTGQNNFTATSLAQEWIGQTSGNISATATKVSRQTIDPTDLVPGEWQQVVVTSLAGSALSNYASVRNISGNLTTIGTLKTGSKVYVEVEFYVLAAGQVGTVGILELFLHCMNPAFGNTTPLDSTQAYDLASLIHAVSASPEACAIAGPFKGTLRTPILTLGTVANAGGADITKYLSVDIRIGTSGHYDIVTPDTSTILLGRCNVVKVS